MASQSSSQQATSASPDDRKFRVNPDQVTQMLAMGHSLHDQVSDIMSRTGEALGAAERGDPERWAVVTAVFQRLHEATEALANIQAILEPPSAGGGAPGSQPGHPGQLPQGSSPGIHILCFQSGSTMGQNWGRTGS